MLQLKTQEISKITDQYDDIVNELSNTIDLDSTIIRAEALFRRFQRRVEAIDKKQNFPKPRVQKAESSSSEPASSSSEPTSHEPQQSKGTGQTKEEDHPKIISPELRKLMSREVEVLPRKVVQRMGDGLHADARK